jgi:hypothetical protein
MIELEADDLKLAFSKTEKGGLLGHRSRRSRPRVVLPNFLEGVQGRSSPGDRHFASHSPLAETP